MQDFNIDKYKEMAHTCELHKSGSRTFAWRIFLGLIPEEKNFVKWVKLIQDERNKFYKREDELRITNNKHLDPKVFNPLAQVENNPWGDMVKDKEVREIINQDIERTY